MSIEGTPPGRLEDEAALPSEPTAPAPRASVGPLLRSLLVWAGIVTLAVIALLATLHLIADLTAILTTPAGRSTNLLRLAVVFVMALAGGGLAVLVVWLAGRGGRREWMAIAIGLVVLIAVRVFVAVMLDGGAQGEPRTYRLMAESLLTPEPDLMGRPVGYAALLAGAYSVISDRQLAAEIVNLLLAVLTGGIVLALARGLYGARVAAVALLGYALWPAGAMMIVVSVPQTAFDLAVVAAAWAAVAAPPGWRGSAVTGAIVGMAQYLRPTAMILLPAYIIARLWPGAPWRRLLDGAILPATAAFLLVLVPVMVYNLDRLGSPSISTSDFGGHSLFMGTYEPSGGRFDREANELLIELAGNDPAARSEKGMELALERIRDDPTGVAGLAVRKQDTLWGTEHYGVQYAVAQHLRDRPEHPRAVMPMVLSQAFYAVLMLAATVGVFQLRREPGPLIPLAVLLVWAVAAIHALLEVRDRYHSYVIPVLLPFAALALVTLLEQVERRVARSPDG